MESSAPPKVSVIIPLYNKAPYIKRALDSVLSQTVQDFEVIVVNDGSKDGGDKIVEEYGDSRIRLINQENQGVSAARNHGVDAAKAELVAFLDADDEWLPDFLENMFQLIMKYPSAGLYAGGSEIINLSSGESKLCLFREKEGMQELSNYFYIMNHECSFMLIATSCMVIPKSVFYSVAGFPSGYIQCEDRAFRGKIALKYTIAYVPKILSKYYMNPCDTEIRASKYLANPFSDYITQHMYEIKERTDYNEIQLFADSTQLSLMQSNIFRLHDSKMIRVDLDKILSKKYRLRKKILKLHTYFPKLFLNIESKILQLLQ